MLLLDYKLGLYSNAKEWYISKKLQIIQLKYDINITNFTNIYIKLNYNRIRTIKELFVRANNK